MVLGGINSGRRNFKLRFFVVDALLSDGLRGVDGLDEGQTTTIIWGDVAWFEDILLGVNGEIMPSWSGNWSWAALREDLFTLVIATLQVHQTHFLVRRFSQRLISFFKLRQRTIKRFNLHLLLLNRANFLNRAYACKILHYYINIIQKYFGWLLNLISQCSSLEYLWAQVTTVHREVFKVLYLLWVIKPCLQRQRPWILLLKWQLAIRQIESHVAWFIV